MKTHIDVIASEEAYKNLSTFKEIEELNQTVRIYRDMINSSVKRSDLQNRLITLLEVLKRHSCKYIGVSFLCKNSIADKMEISYKTVQRLVKKLEILGMIKQIPMKRESDMLQTANAIIILPAPMHKHAENKMSDKTPKEVSDQENNFSPKTNNKIINTRNNIAKANFVAHWVPERFASFVNSFYREAKTIEEFWKVVKQNNRIVDHLTGEKAFSKDEEVNIGITAMKEFVMKIKSGKRIKNIFGYFNGIVDNVMTDAFFDTL